MSKVNVAAKVATGSPAQPKTAAAPAAGGNPSPAQQRANANKPPTAAQQQKAAAKEKEASNYFKYLKYNPGAISLSGSAKEMAWWANPESKPGEGDIQTPAFIQVEIAKDDNKSFTVILPDGSQKTLEKNEKYYNGVNRPKFDGSEDNGELPHLNEPAVLHNLKKRYFADLFHTYSGLFLVVINPYKRLPVYTDEIIDIYRGQPRDKMAPHIYAMADNAYRAMLNERKNQSMLITGESGAGKTENTKRVIQYLTNIAGSSTGDKLLENQLIEFNPILEAFGNAKTLKNNNSSRFGKFIELQFNSGGQICGANTLIYLLEKSRVVKRAKNERSFHIFYQIMSKAMPADQKEKLHLTKPEDFEYLKQSECYVVNRMEDDKEFEHSLKALNILKISDNEKFALFEVLSAILHMGNLPFQDTAKGACELTDTKALGYAAQHLGVDPNKLKQGLISPTLTIGTGEKVQRQYQKYQASSTRDALARALYGRMFLWVVRRINEVLSHPDDKDQFLGVLDIAGFEIFQENSFEQLCINFTNEKLQQFFNNHMFKLEQDEYEREQIGWNFVNFGLDLQDTIDLLEKEPNGILIQLDDENSLKGADDTSFTKKVQASHENHRSFRKPKYEGNSFSIVHYAGIVPYNTKDWLEKNRDPLEPELQQLLRDSEKTFVRGLFDNRLASESTATPNEDNSAKRAAVTRKKGDRGAGFQTVAVAYKEQLSQLMDVLRDTSPHFVRCIIPNHKQLPGAIDDNLVSEQLRCNGVLEGIRIARKGWPNRLKFPEFLKRYHLLRPGLDLNRVTDPKQSSKDLCDYLIGKNPDKVDKEKVRYGVTKIFFRSGQLAVLEQMREQIISGMVVSIQACSRAYIARRSYMKSHEAEFAARRIQKFIRAWLEIKNWGWWKVYLKGRNLYSQRNYQAEIDELESKIKAIEVQIKSATDERNKLKKAREDSLLDISFAEQDTAKLKAKIEELAGEKGTLSRTVDGLRKDVSDTEGDLKEETARVNALMKAKQDLIAVRSQLEANNEDEASKGRAINESKRKIEGERDDAKAKSADEEIKAEDLQKRFNQLENDVDDASDRALKSEQSVAKLRNEQKDQEKALAAAEEKLHNVGATKGLLERARNELDKEIHENTSAIEGAKAELDAAEGALKRLQATLDQAIAELNDVREKAVKSERQEKEFRAKVKELEENVEAERERKERLEKDSKALEERVKELETQSRGLEADKFTAGEATKNLKATLDDAQRRFEEGEALALRLRSEKKNLTEAISELESQLESEVESGRKDKRRLAQKVTELQDKVANAPKGDASLEELKKLELDMKDAIEDHAAADKARSAAEKKQSSLSIEIEDLRQQLEDRNRVVTRAEGTGKRVEGDLAETRENIANERDAIKNLEDNAARLKAEGDDFRKRLTDLTGGAGLGDNYDYKRENRTLKKDIADLDRENRAHERELRQLKDKLAEAQGVLDSERKERERLTAESDDLRARFIEQEKVSTQNIAALVRMDAALAAQGAPKAQPAAQPEPSAD